MPKNVTIIGHFGGNERFTDGQTVKTKNLYEALRKNTDWNICKVDTYYKKNPFKLIVDTIKGTVGTRDIIILISGNGMKVYFPLLSFFARRLGKRIYHDVIGGNLSDYVKKYPKYKDYLNSFTINWVETKLLKKELETCGVMNAAVLPNFRSFKSITIDCLQTHFTEPYRFCTFSRVIKEKGIEDAIIAIENINKMAEKTLCTLDIYGPVDNRYKNDFEKIMAKSTDAIKYMGTVKPESAINTLKSYYGVLFPTVWVGEGVAGTIVESFIAGVPVIATDWRSNNELIKNGYNGLTYPCEFASNLENGIKWLVGQKNNIKFIKENCLKTAEYYKPQKHIEMIVHTIENIKAE